jgi:hypothetical protein
VVAGLGSWLRNRRSVQSAARLIHAELTDNSAAIVYYRRIGEWPRIGEMHHSAWDEHGGTLSRMRSATAFHAIQRGYSALEAIVFVVQADASGSLPFAIGQDIVNGYILEVKDALKKAGELGGIPSDELRALGAALESQAPPADGSAHVLRSGAILPPALVSAIAERGSATQQQAARRTLEAMPDPDSREPAVAVNRLIRDAENQTDLTNARIVRREGDAAIQDDAANELYDGFGDSFKFFLAVFGRNSFDGRGGRLEGIVHYGEKFNNLFWDGQRVVAGDGDGELFSRFTVALEVIGHEVAVGVIQAECKLTYANQAGAVVNAIANVFGLLVKQYKLSQTAEQADWRFGVGVLEPRLSDGALMSLAAPGTAYSDPVLGNDPQVAHMGQFVRTAADNGGVHVNSGIPGHAFYTTAITLGGYAWERAGRIWYEALRDPRLRATSGFRTFATATRVAAIRLYGDDGEEVAAVDAGWEAVGVKYTG